MDGVDHHHHGRLTRRRSRTLKERLGWRGMGCCGGATWGFRPTTTTTTIINGSDSEDDQQHHQYHHQLQLLQEDQQEPTNQETINVTDPACSSPAPVNSSGSHSMNLAAALAAERHFRAVEGTNLVDVNNSNSNSNSNTSSGGGAAAAGNVGPTITAPGTPLRVSLMRLLAETDGGDGEEERAAVGVGGGGGGNDTVCCVCMVRKKGAAFIPCGHTFCRVCSREVCLNRGSCPLCNRSILEVLDIF